MVRSNRSKTNELLCDEKLLIMLCPMLLTNHNLYFLVNTMKKIQTAIEEGRFMAYKKEFYERYGY